MDESLDYRQKLIEEYKRTTVPLLKYLPWLEKNAGQQGSTLYQGNGENQNALRFPVYDATLMGFVREAASSPLMYRNYSYVYTRNGIRTHEDERKVIAGAELKDWDLLRGILSRYVLGGRTKAALWSEAVKENIFCLVLERMQKIIEYWDKPLDIR